MKKFYFLSAALLFSLVNCFSQPGSLDVSFGPSGKVSTNIIDLNKSNDAIQAMAIQADGKIVVAGITSAPNIPNSAIPSMIIRYNPDGTLDNSFDYDGMFFAYGFKFTSLAIQPDGKIIAAGDRFSL